MKKSTKAWSMKMRLALLALAALAWIAVPVSARAETNVWDGTIASGFAGGDGTQNNPFQIETAAQLAHFAKTVNEGEAYLYKYIVLTADIDLANKEWTPIGNHSNLFKGNFNGNNHTVTGMQIRGELDRVGLFGECKKFNVDSAIKNITVKDSVICGNKFVGAIVGSAEEINIENCRSIGNTINGETDVGGICGKIGGYSVGKVSQCYNSSKVTGQGRVGGIAGMGGIAENCLNTGEITIIREGYRSACGGIFGIFGDATTSARVTACVNLGKVSGGESFGGIVGKTETSSTGHISNCYYNMDAITGGFDAGTALTAGQLCGALPEGLDSTIWKEGGVDTSTAKATQGRFGTATGTYINLTKVADIKETKTAPVPVYNYVTTNGDDWDTYTLITTAEEFAAIGQDTANCNENYVLKNDIDVSGVELRSIGNPGTPYIGKFSGDGHTISYVDMTKENDVYSSGLFAQIGYTQNQLSESGKVMLLAANGVIASNAEAGGICGDLSVGEIYGCSFTGTVKGYTAGGICGNAGQNTIISQCFFAGDVQGKDSAAGICGKSPSQVIDHCISIAAVTSGKDCAGIVNSGDYGTTNCYFNNDICNVEDEYKLGRSTQQLTSSGFFKVLKDNGFDSAIWTKKANDKETGTAYYPSLGENNAVGVNYTTGLSFERADTNTPTYGENITFKVKALVNFVTNGQPIPAEDTEGSFEIRIGDTTVVSAADFKNGIATYRAQTAGETTFTLVYTGTNSSFFPEQTTKNLTVNINPAPLTVVGEGIAGGTYGNKLSELKVTGLTAKLGTEIIGGNWQIIGDEVPCVGDDGTYTATFTPAQHPEYYQPLTASVKLAIEKAEVSAIPMQNLYYSWAAKGEKEVQIPGLPEDRGTTELISTVKSDDAKVLATDQAIRYSEGKLIFTLGENTMEDITHSATIQIVLGSQNYKDICVDITIHRTAKADREDTPDPDAFDMTFTVSGNDLAAQITTDRTDVEFSFDGTDWGQTKSTGVGHNEKVTAQIRYAETDDYNASPAVSKTWNSGHGPLNRHDRVEPTCQAEGSIEYWTCDVCGLYFASADGSKSITATEIVLPKTDHSWAEGYLSDMTGHWHKCGVCGITSNTEKHASGGAATTERAEICTICGYEIAPKKPAASNDDDSSQASNTDRKATDAAAPPVATATPATPGVVKPSVIPVPPTTPTADENRKEDAAKPSGEAQDTQESSGEAPQEERIDSMTAQTSGSQESGTEQITETSGKGTNAGRVAAAAAAGAVVVGGGGAAVYVTMIKGKFKFK
jgi:fibronectin type III domain protein